MNVIKGMRVIVWNVRSNSKFYGTVERVTKTQFKVQPDGTHSSSDLETFEIYASTWESGEHPHFKSKGGRWKDMQCFPAKSEAHVVALIKKRSDEMEQKRQKRDLEAKKHEARRAEQLATIKARVDLARDTRLMDTVNDVQNRVIDVQDESGNPYARVTITIWQCKDAWSGPFRASYTYMKWTVPGSYSSCGSFCCSTVEEGVWEALRSAYSWF